MSDPNVPDPSRRRFTAGLGLSSTALAAAPAGLLLPAATSHAQSANPSKLERMEAQLDVVTRSTMAGVVAFMVPGSDLYSLVQGRSTFASGGVAAKGDAFLVYMFNHYLPLPGAAELAADLGKPFQGVNLPLGDGTSTTLGTAVTQVLGTKDSVPLSTLLALLLNALALYVNPASALGTLFLSPFAALSFSNKARVFELLELPASDTVRLISERIQEPVTKTLLGYVQLSALGLLAFSAAGSYSEWAVLDPATRTLKSRPVGWSISKYQGVSDGWNEFKGYYQGRRSASDA